VIQRRKSLRVRSSIHHGHGELDYPHKAGNDGDGEVIPSLRGGMADKAIQHTKTNWIAPRLIGARNDE